MQSRVLAVKYTVVLWLVSGLGARGGATPAEPSYWEKRQLALELVDTKIRDFQNQQPQSPASALYELVDASSALTAADYDALGRREVTAGGPAAAAFAEKLTAWYQSNRTYQGLVDQQILAREAYVIERTRFELSAQLAMRSPLQQELATSLFKDLEATFQRWHEKREVISPVDPREQKQRLYSHGEYFVKARLLANMLGLVSSEAAPATSQPSGGRFASLRLFLQSFQNIGKTLLGPTPTKTVQVLTKTMRSLAAVRGYEVKVEGREHLDAALAEYARSGQMFMVLPSHRTTLGDAVLVSSLGLEQALAFSNTLAAGRMVFGTWERGARWLGQLLANQDDVVGVGDCRGRGQPRPYAKLKQSLDKGLSGVVINYPQGFTSDGVIPTNRGFTSKLLRPLYESGRKPPLLVASYEIESTFLQSDDEALRQGAVVTIHRPLPGNFINLVLPWEADEMPQLVNMMIRALWLDHIRVHPHLSVAAYQARIKQALGVDILASKSF